MFENLPLLQSIKRLLTKKTTTKYPENLVTFYDLYNERYQRPWEITVNELDRKKIHYAVRTGQSMPITNGLSDIQLLKLHAVSFPEYDNQLIYHDMFDLYEVKYRQKTIAIFSYRSGVYTPINDL